MCYKNIWTQPLLRLKYFNKLWGRVGLVHFQQILYFYIPEIVRKPLVFWCFKGVQKWNIGVKWIDILGELTETERALISLCHPGQGALQIACILLETLQLSSSINNDLNGEISSPIVVNAMTNKARIITASEMQITNELPKKTNDKMRWVINSIRCYC